MSKKTTQLPIFIFIWLIMIGGIFWWWQSRDKEKETIEIEVKEKPSLLKESGPAAVGKTKLLKEKNTLSDERRIADLNQVKGAFEIYHAVHGRYPRSFDELIPDYFSSPSFFLDKYRLGSDDQKFCLWIELMRGAGYYVVSNCGAKKVGTSPYSLDLDECCELTKP
ncbi:hypothetical protein J7J95_03065 [bacterium]|nr:hypothetical protein [bacterium]